MAALLLTGCDVAAKTYDEALVAYSQNRIAEAETVFRNMTSDPGASADDKARAWRELARIAWLIDGNAAAALDMVMRAEGTGEGACDNARLRARILQEANGDAELVQQAELLAGRCPDRLQAAKVRLHAVEAILDVAASDPAGRSGALAAGKRLLAEMNPEVRGSPEGAAAALQLALLGGDAEAALKAWKEYFWLTDPDVPQGLRQTHSSASMLFQAGLAPAAAPEAKLLLLDLLVRGGFAQAAARFASWSGLSSSAAAHPLWRKASAYLDARRELEAIIIASNRRVARGGKAADLKAAAGKAIARLMAAAALKGDPQQALRQAYGLYGQVGDTDGYASVHYGHIVQDERRLIEQYGHRAQVAFIALDNMISNGFNSWLWDGRAAIGGWASPGPVIVQVRAEYTSNPLSAWSLFSGGRERQRFAERQSENAMSDLAGLKRHGVAYLPGLADRLRVQVADQIGARAKSKAGEGPELRRAFLDEYWRATFQASILAHEGRHALDKKLVTGLMRLNDSNLEYRAKLSELALADYPRLALLNINDSTIGSGSAHGKANERVLRAYSEWMRANPSRINGYDPAVPALVQLDRLSDEQIRAVARSYDPIAKQRASK